MSTDREVYDDIIFFHDGVSKSGCFSNYIQYCTENMKCNKTWEVLVFKNQLNYFSNFQKKFIQYDKKYILYL